MKSKTINRNPLNVRMNSRTIKTALIELLVEAVPNLSVPALCTLIKSVRSDNMEYGTRITISGLNGKELDTLIMEADKRSRRY